MRSEAASANLGKYEAWADLPLHTGQQPAHANWAGSEFFSRYHIMVAPIASHPVSSKLS